MSLPVAFHPIYRLPLPEHHRFPMEKYAALPKKLLDEKIVTKEDFFAPEPADISHVLKVHQKTYIDKLIDGSIEAKEMRKVGFPWSPLLVERELRIAQGTITGCLKAMETGVAFNIAGGTHHAYSTHGEAFCMINDQAVGAAYLLDHTSVKRIAILDYDVHQGNGTAEIFAQNANVFTCSIHGKNNYPFRKEISDLDIPLDDNVSDDEFLSWVQRTTQYVLDVHQPDFVFYLSGVDILAEDKLGRLGCSLKGCYERDQMVFKACKERHIPVQVSMGGGYAPHLNTIVEAHANTYKAAKELYKS